MIRKALLALALVLALIAIAKHGKVFPLGKSAPNAASAISYAEAQLGKPYSWGATGPDAFDCSGLIYRAYRLPWSDRTSQEQWANLPHVASSVPGDLVYFTGLLNPGEQPPGHVGLVIGAHLMIDAYGGSIGVVRQSFGLPDSPQGLTNPLGYTSP